MGRKILVTSGKGGVGKTTIVAGLAYAIAKHNYSVCVVDGDMGLNNLDLIMGVENKVVYDLCDCMQGKCHIKQAIIKDENRDNLYTLSAGKSLPSNIIYSFKFLMDKLATLFDFVIVDSPAGKDIGFKMASSACGEALVVVTPHLSSIRDASKIITILSGDESKTNINLVVNRIRGDLVVSKQMLSYKDMQKILHTKGLGVLPESDRYNITSAFNFAFGSKDELSNAFDILAKNLLEETDEEYDYLSKYKGIAGFIRRKLRSM